MCSLRKSKLDRPGFRPALSAREQGRQSLLYAEPYPRTVQLTCY